MKVVASLVHYLIQRNLLSQQEKEELQLKGFLDPYLDYEHYYSSDDDDYQDRWPFYDPAESSELTSVEDEKEAGPRGRSGRQKPGAGPKLPELEALIRQSAPAIEENLLRLKPIAEELGLTPTSSEWARLFQNVSEEHLRTAVHAALTGGTLPFDHLWRLVSEDCWQELVPARLRFGNVWNAWRVLVDSKDGEIPRGYRWILRSAPVATVYRQMRIQRKIVAATAAIFREEPDVLWRAVTRPLHQAGYLALSFAYTAAVWQRAQMPVRSVFRTSASGAKCFAADNKDRVALAGTGGGLSIYLGTGEEAQILDRKNHRIEALAFHPSQDILSFSVTDETGENHVVEFDLTSRRERDLLQAFAWSESDFIFDWKQSLVAYKPSGVNGLRFFRRDVPGSYRYLSFPHSMAGMQDINFLPGGKYVKVKVRQTSDLTEDLILDCSNGAIAKRFETGPRKQTRLHGPKGVLAFCSPELSEIYDSSGLDLLARDAQPLTLPSGNDWLGAQFSHDGRWLARWSACEILVWDWNSAAKSLLLENSAAPGDIYWPYFHQNVVAAFRELKMEENYHAQIDMWDLETGTIRRSVSCENFSDSTNYWFSLDDGGALSLARSRNPSVGLLLEVWRNFGDGEKITLKLLENEMPGEVIDCRMLPHSDLALLRFRTSPAEILTAEFSLTQRKITSQRTISVPPSRQVDYHYDFDCSSGRNLIFYDTLTGEKTHEFRIKAHTNLVTSLKNADDGRFLIAYVENQSLVRIDLAAGAPNGEVAVPQTTSQLTILHVSSGAAAETLVLLASGDHLKIVEIGPEESRTRFEREIPGSGDVHHGLAGTLSPQPQVAYGAGGQLEILDLTDADSNAIFLHPLDDGGDWVPAFSPCGRFLSAIRKGEFRMWTSHGQALHRRLFTCEAPSSVQYSPDGKALWIWDQFGTFWKICVSSLEAQSGARIPSLELPVRKTSLRAWTLAQKLSAIKAGDWVPLLAAVCSESGDSSRFTYADLGLQAPVL